MERYPAKYLDRCNYKQDRGDDPQGSDKQGKNARSTDKEQAGGPEADPGTKGRTTSGQIHRRAGQQQALAYREHDVAGRNEILTLPEEMDGQQRARHDEASAVDAPGQAPQRVGRSK